MSATTGTSWEQEQRNSGNVSRWSRHCVAYGGTPSANDRQWYPRWHTRFLDRPRSTCSKRMSPSQVLPEMQLQQQHQSKLSSIRPGAQSGAHRTHTRQHSPLLWHVAQRTGSISMAGSSSRLLICRLWCPNLDLLPLLRPWGCTRRSGARLMRRVSAM